MHLCLVGRGPKQMRLRRRRFPIDPACTLGEHTDVFVFHRGPRYSGGVSHARARLGNNKPAPGIVGDVNGVASTAHVGGQSFGRFAHGR
jgi:hypothetical protein